MKRKRNSSCRKISNECDSFKQVLWLAASHVRSSGLTIAGLALWPEYLLDYALAYLLGVLFQYFAIAPMHHLSVGPGLWAAIKADTLSLTAFEVGLFGWMALTSLIFFHSSIHPDNPVYWFMMQMGMVIGFGTSYPMN